MPAGKGTYGRKRGRPKKQGYDARLDESLAMRRGKESSKKQSYKSRRDESKGMEKSSGKRAFASVGTMDDPRHGGKAIKPPKAYSKVV